MVSQKIISSPKKDYKIIIAERTKLVNLILGEHLVPKESSVSLNIFAVHRDPNQYENANAFDPDHFLPENIAKRHPYAFIPFGMGKRKCVGKAKIIRKFYQYLFDYIYEDDNVKIMQYS